MTEELIIVKSQTDLGISDSIMMSLKVIIMPLYETPINKYIN